MANEQFLNAAANIENAIANILSFAQQTGNQGFIERILRLAIKKEIVLELLLEEVGAAFTPAYRNFWQNTFVTVPFGQDIPFNNQSVAFAGGIILLSPTTVFIPEAGDYEINYVVTTNNISPAGVSEQQVTAILNGAPVPNFQTSFGMRITNAESGDQFGGTAILRVPANSTLSLRNTSLNGESLALNDLIESGAALDIKKLG